MKARALKKYIRSSPRKMRLVIAVLLIFSFLFMVLSTISLSPPLWYLADNVDISPFNTTCNPCINDICWEFLFFLRDAARLCWGRSGSDIVSFCCMYQYASQKLDQACTPHTLPHNASNASNAAKFVNIKLFLNTTFIIQLVMVVYLHVCTIDRSIKIVPL